MLPRISLALFSFADCGFWFEQSLLCQSMRTAYTLWEKAYCILTLLKRKQFIKVWRLLTLDQGRIIITGQPQLAQQTGT